SAATVLSPEILVLDEVLGVGDAYFAQKSYERIRTLCEGQGTTVLLVSHDIYSASRICDRMLWLDQGRIIMDGDCTSVMHAYEDSIRQQEEIRLRERRLASLKENCRSNAMTDSLLFGQINSVGRGPIEEPLYFSALRLYQKTRLLDELHLGKDDESAAIQLLTEPGEGNWGEIQDYQERSARPFDRYGSIHHRVPFCIRGVEAQEA